MAEPDRNPGHASNSESPAIGDIPHTARGTPSAGALNSGPTGALNRTSDVGLGTQAHSRPPKRVHPPVSEDHQPATKTRRTARAAAANSDRGENELAVPGKSNTIK